ncbi:MAG: hypothetical protein ABI639_13620, partial [Thermoanaerobaculia bacterium]
MMKLAGDEENGNDTFTYDKVGRLASATFYSPLQLGTEVFNDDFEVAVSSTPKFPPCWRLKIPPF